MLVNVAVFPSEVAPLTGLLNLVYTINSYKILTNHSEVLHFTLSDFCKTARAIIRHELSQKREGAFSAFAPSS